MRRALLERFGTAQAVLDVPASLLREVPGVGQRLSQRIRNSGSEIDVDREIRLCRENQIAILTEADAHYPRLLREIPDPPGVLFCAGIPSPRTNWPSPSLVRVMPPITEFARRNGWQPGSPAPA